MVMTLRPEQQEVVQHLIDRYKYDSADTVIDEALVLLAEQQHIARMRRIVAAADEDIAQGRVHQYSPEFIEMIQDGADKMLRGELEPDLDAWW